MTPRRYVIFSLVICAAAAGLGAALYSHIPERAPVHWNIHGEVDRYGPRWELAFAMPAVLAGVVLLMAMLPLLGPFRRNFERFRETYGRICVTIAAGLAAVQVVLLL